MKKTLARTLLGLALLGFIIPAAGCDLRRGSSALGSFSNAAFGFDIVPSFGGFDVFEEEYVVTEFGVDVFDDYSGYDSYDDSYFDDGYYDGWKKKSSG